MIDLLTTVRPRLPRALAARPRLLRSFFAVTGISLVCVSTGIAFLLHFNLATAGSIELFLVVLVAVRLGFLQATIVSVGAVVALNYLFTPPIFKFTVADPQNWVSLFTFEAAALLVSGLSAKVRRAVEAAELQRLRSMKLYELSRAILLIDGRTSVTAQLSSLIRELIQVDEAGFWVVYDSAGPAQLAAITPAAHSAAHSASQTYANGGDADDAASGSAYRILRVGTTAIGAMTLHGRQIDPLLADAVASLSAIAIERARAIQRENQAEAERNTERLRTAVLDGLAHGFKTPLTAIRTASTGLLAIDRMSPTEAELVSIIDDQAAMLTQLTTRLLQTAALESREVRLKRTSVSIPELVHHVLAEQPRETQVRIDADLAEDLLPCEVDAPMIELALLQLVDNAVKYSPVGGEIKIAIRQTEAETIVAVENRGAGIKPEERERIFHRFYRGAEALRGPAGTGLGLSIVKKTAEAHGGHAWVECDDTFTRFLFTVQNNRKASHG